MPIKTNKLEGISWKRGLKSSFSFGFSGIILMLLVWTELDLGLFIFIIPSGMSGLIFSYLLKEQLQSNKYFLISPVIITAGLLFSIITYLAVGSFLPSEVKRNEFHFFWMSGLICSTILGVLFSLSHPVMDKIKTTLTAVVCCTGLSLLFGTIYDTVQKEPFIWIAATIWLMVFGLTMGVKIKETGTNRVGGR